MTEKAPSSTMVQQAMEIWHSTRARLLETDPDLADDEAQLIGLLEAETTDLAVVKDRLVSAIIQAKAMAKMTHDLIERLEAREARYRTRTNNYRATLLAILGCTGERRFETAAATVWRSLGPPKVIITDESLVPEAYWRTKTERSIDRMAIFHVFNQHGTVPGAEYDDGAPTLTVRTK